MKIKDPKKLVQTIAQRNLAIVADKNTADTKTGATVENAPPLALSDSETGRKILAQLNGREKLLERALKSATSPEQRAAIKDQLKQIAAEKVGQREATREELNEALMQVRRKLNAAAREGNQTEVKRLTAELVRLHKQRTAFFR
jgi:hypothetical protein